MNRKNSHNSENSPTKSFFKNGKFSEFDEWRCGVGFARRMDFFEENTNDHELSRIFHEFIYE